MNDPHVVALIYEIEHDSSVDYSESKSINCEADRFLIRIEDNRVRVEVREHHPTEEAALEVVKPYIRSWVLDEALNRRPGVFKLRFDRSEIVDRRPTPGVHAVAAHPVSFHVTVRVPTVVVKRPYPTPPDGARLDADNPDVMSMFNRYEGYLNGREPLPGMAYFCLTVFEGLFHGDRTKSARSYGIGKKVLDTFGRLASTKGGPTERPTERRKADREEDGIQVELTQEEKRFLEEAVKALIRRVAEVAHDPHRALEQITMKDLPRLPR